LEFQGVETMNYLILIILHEEHLVTRTLRLTFTGFTKYITVTCGSGRIPEQ